MSFASTINRTARPARSIESNTHSPQTAGPSSLARGAMEGLERRTTGPAVKPSKREGSHPSEDPSLLTLQPSSGHLQKKPLSARRQHFLNCARNMPRPLAIRMDELKDISEYIHAKHGISTFISGEVDPKLLKNHHNSLRVKWEISENAVRATPGTIEKIKLKHYNDDKFWALSICEALRDHPLPGVPPQKQKEIDDPIPELEKRYFDLNLEQLNHLVPHAIKRRGLTPEDAAKEILLIARDPQGKSHAYLYPKSQFNRFGTGHTHTHIISSAGKVINAIPYIDTGVPVVEGEYSSSLKQLTGGLFSGAPIATKIGCGALGIAYIKKYLKDDGKLLNDYTLLIDGKLGEVDIKFHISPPDAIKYSHSKQYATAIREIVKSDSSFITLFNKDTHVNCPTLTALVSEGAVISRPNGDILTSADLISFQTKWLTRDKVCQAQRAQMQIDDKNHYLTYVSTRQTETLEKAGLLRYSDVR